MSQAGKGDTYRKVDIKKWGENHSNIFRKKFNIHWLVKDENNFKTDAGVSYMEGKDLESARDLFLAENPERLITNIYPVLRVEERGS